MDKREDIINIAKAFKKEVQRVFPLKIDRFYLFGSYAKGNPREHSDIDVALVVDHYEGRQHDLVLPLWMMRGDIDCRIEPHLVARDRDYAGFLEEIQQTGVEI
jgi:predicted nucleotidyltransferase